MPKIISVISRCSTDGNNSIMQKYRLHRSTQSSIFVFLCICTRFSFTVKYKKKTLLTRKKQTPSTTRFNCSITTFDCLFSSYRQLFDLTIVVLVQNCHRQKQPSILQGSVLRPSVRPTHLSIRHSSVRLSWCSSFRSSVRLVRPPLCVVRTSDRLPYHPACRPFRHDVIPSIRLSDRFSAVALSICSSVQYRYDQSVNHSELRPSYFLTHVCPSADPSVGGVARPPAHSSVCPYVLLSVCRNHP